MWGQAWKNDFFLTHLFTCLENVRPNAALRYQIPYLVSLSYKLTYGLDERQN